MKVDIKFTPVKFEKYKDIIRTLDSFEKKFKFTRRVDSMYSNLNAQTLKEVQKILKEEGISKETKAKHNDLFLQNNSFLKMYDVIYDLNEEFKEFENESSLDM